MAQSRKWHNLGTAKAILAKISALEEFYGKRYYSNAERPGPAGDV
jgi:hypothetical protein